MDTLLMTLNFWHWLILGVVLLMLELTTGGGFLLWVATSSFCISLIAYFFPSMDWPWQLLWFSALSLVICFLWWRYLKKCTERSDEPNLNQRVEQYIGREFNLATPIHNGRGKIKIGDSYWPVEGGDLPVGNKVVVVAVDGVILKVKPVVSFTSQ